MRDGVVFINERVIAVNVEGLTGKKKGFTSIPYSKISAYSIETAGAFGKTCPFTLLFKSWAIRP